MKVSKAAKRDCRNALITAILSPFLSLLVLLPAATRAQTVPAIPVANTPSTPPALQPTPENPGHLVHEWLAGSGGGNYVLSHGNVIPNTLHLFLDGRELTPGKDYLLDPATGSLVLSVPVPSGDLLSATYRYLDQPSGPSVAPIAPGLQFNLGANAQLGLLLGLTASDGHGFNTTLKGLSLSSAFGKGGLGSYSGLAYFSNVQRSQNIVFDPQALFSTPPPNNLTGRGQLILQNLALHSGGLTFTANYQDVGAKFNGFAALKQGFQGNQSMLQQLNQLESERGIKRLGFGLDWNGGKNGSASVLALNWNRIDDGSGTIEQRSAELHAGLLGVHYNFAQIGQNFKLFSGLREAQKADWMHQTGLRESQFGLNVAFAGNKKSPTAGGLDFENEHISAKSGAFDRSAFSLQTKGLDIGYTHNAITKGFGRLGDLSLSDKTELALDTYHLYDPTIATNVVSPVDLAQVVANDGLDRSGFHLLLDPSPKSRFAFSQLALRLTGALRAKSDSVPNIGMLRQSLEVQLGGFHFALINRRTSAAFDQLSALPDIDKRYLALDILHQFDPTADLSKLPPPLIAQAALHEAGLARTLLNASLQLGKGNKASSLSFSAVTIKDTSATASSTSASKATSLAAAPTPAIARESFAIATPQFQLGITQQAISNNFTRLPQLSDVEKAQFGNEYGLRSLLLDFNWQINKTTHLAFTSLGFSPTPDAVAATLAQTRARGIDKATAQQMANAGLQHQTLSFTTQGLTLNADFANVDKYFTRATDLALPAADRNLLNSERGFRRAAISLHLDKIKGLTLDTYDYGATNLFDLLTHAIFHHNLVYTPRQNFSLTYSDDGDLATTKGLANGYQHRVVALNTLVKKGIGLKLSDEVRVNLTDSRVGETIHQQNVHIDTTQLGPGGAVDYQVQQAASLDGKFTDFTSMSLHTQPTQYLTLDYTRSDLRRSPDANNPVEKDKPVIVENTEGYGVKYQATKQLALTVNTTTTVADDQNGKSAVSLGLQGEPCKDITLAAQFDELHTKADQNTHDVANFSIRNTKPISIGPLQNLTIQAGYASLNDHRKLINETMTGHIEWTLWKNTFALDYSGQTLPSGQSTTTRLYSFATDPNPHRWLHASFYYRDWTMLDGKVILTRKFMADAKLTPMTHLVYNYGSLPDDGHGQFIPETAVDFSLQNDFRDNLTVGLFYRLSRNTATKLLTRSLGFSLQQKLDPKESFTFSFSKGVNGSAIGYDRSDQLNIAFERKLSGDDFFSIGATWVTHDGRDAAGRLLRNELRGELSFNFLF
ncbi:hypothetical protein CTKA_01617 [Chthonomonas calidirosea]|uniref:Autotransporter domain-containing protein n=1 Tax=Chthonomonas calidirosea (strain DSM 23976 / ICMP 18418 / T49) TaxID=1303518 RepID=S0EWJ6_CHTCT|nr:hypothetical protein CCALI_02475 [Chthonomonas calidirosea T49]CEK17822.1 hypothetical protein CTKA_01617 [Chthonomonas calidirosea]